MKWPSNQFVPKSWLKCFWFKVTLWPKLASEPTWEAQQFQNQTSLVASAFCTPVMTNVVCPWYALTSAVIRLCLCLRENEHALLLFSLQVYLWLLSRLFHLQRLLCWYWCCILVCMVSHNVDWREVPRALTYYAFSSSIGSLYPCLWWSSCVHALRVLAMAIVNTMWSAGWHTHTLLPPLWFQLQVTLCLETWRM